jgi:hypothetical protein
MCGIRTCGGEVQSLVENHRVVDEAYSDLVQIESRWEIGKVYDGKPLAVRVESGGHEK